MNKQTCKATKVSIIGCGKVGMTSAYSIIHAGLVNELVLVGRDKSKLVGEQLDLEHGMSFLSQTKVKITDDYQDISGSDIVVFTAGAAQKPGDTRLDLAQKNLALVTDLIPKIVKNAPDALILMVSNPVDIMTYKAYRLAGLKKGKIFGTGTTLDTARFRYHIAEHIKVNPRSIHAYVLGEHGDHSFPVLSSASVGGQPLLSFENFNEQKAMQAYTKARDAAYKIISTKGATYYAIGAVVSHIIKAILTDSKSILPLSIPLNEYHEISGIALSVPCVLGINGVEKTLEIKLSWEEKNKLHEAATVLKSYL